MLTCVLRDLNIKYDLTDSVSHQIQTDLLKGKQHKYNFVILNDWSDFDQVI